MRELNNDGEQRKEDGQKKRFYIRPRFDAVYLIADQTLGECNLLSGDSACEPFSKNS